MKPAQRSFVFTLWLRAAVVVAGLGLAAVIARQVRLVSAASRGATSGPCGFVREQPRHYRHVIWIVMENKGFSQIVGSPRAPYLNKLAKRCGLATRFRAETHPSSPNFIAMTAGSTYGVNGHENPYVPRTGSSPRAGYPGLGVPNIFSQLGHNWRVLAESMNPHNCSASNSLYSAQRNPSVYFRNTRAACGKNDVPFTTTLDLSAGFTLIVPDLYHSMHTVGKPNSDAEVLRGDRWAARFLPKILGSPKYRASDTVIFVTWDEDDSETNGQNRIVTIVIAPSVPAHTTSSLQFNHYSLLRTTEDLLGIRRHLGAASRARGMRHAFHF